MRSRFLAVLALVPALLLAGCGNVAATSSPVPVKAPSTALQKTHVPVPAPKKKPAKKQAKKQDKKKDRKKAAKPATKGKQESKKQDRKQEQKKVGPAPAPRPAAQQTDGDKVNRILGEQQVTDPGWVGELANRGGWFFKQAVPDKETGIDTTAAQDGSWIRYQWQPDHNQEGKMALDRIAGETGMPEAAENIIANNGSSQWQSTGWPGYTAYYQNGDVIVQKQAQNGGQAGTNNH